MFGIFLAHLQLKFCILAETLHTIVDQASTTSNSLGIDHRFIAKYSILVMSSRNLAGCWFHIEANGQENLAHFFTCKTSDIRFGPRLINIPCSSVLKLRS